jgi:hypothetical protein
MCCGHGNINHVIGDEQGDDNLIVKRVRLRFEGVGFEENIIDPAV